MPSLARAMIESVEVETRLGTLRSWTLSGEELRGDLLNGLQQRLPNCRFVNLYGSSEVAADATYFVAGNWDESRAELTAERFIPDPFGGDSQGRTNRGLFRTQCLHGIC